MSNTELINAYFDNELNASEKKLFEDRLARDTELQREFQFQEDIIEGIREARRQSLKARLNNVDVGGASSGGSSWTAGKIAGIIGLAAIAGFGIYYFYPDNDPVIQDTPVVIEEQQEEPATTLEAEPETSENTADATDAEEPEAQENITASTAEEAEEGTETTDEEQPEVMAENKNPVVAPSFDDPDNEETTVDIPAGDVDGKAVVASDNLEVAVEADNRRYDFHYMLENEKLVLYGNFQDDLYEILEFNTNDMKAWFLSFDGKYFRLDPTNGKVEELQQVTDQQLLRTLREASGK